MSKTQLVPTRYEAVTGTYHYTANKRNEGWTLIRVPIGKPKIPPHTQILVNPNTWKDDEQWLGVMREDAIGFVFETLADAADNIF